MKKYVYDADAYDKYNYATYRFLLVASCGVHVNINHITERKSGRSDYHLLYVESGEMVCEKNGVTEILRPGGYVLYLPKERQRYEQNSGVCYWVHFSGTAVEELLSDAGLKWKPLSLGGEPNQTIIDSFEKMIYRFITRGHSNDLALSAELLSLLSRFKNLLDEQTNPVMNERLYPVITYLNKHFFEKVELADCAKMMHISTGRFSHIFKECTGVSPYAYILNLRMKMAAELLALSDLPIAEIAYKTGFDNPLYFSKIFKKQYGVSPSSFRIKQENVPRLIGSTGCD